MTYRFEVFDSYAALLRSSIMRNRTASPICPGIDLAERCGLPDIDTYYVAVYDEQRYLGLFHFQLLHIRPHHFRLGSSRVVTHVLRVMLTCTRPTLLVAGHLFRHDRLFLSFETGLSNEAQSDLFYRTLQHMSQTLKPAGVFIKDAAPYFLQQVNTDASFVRMKDDISMQLPIAAEWKEMADYEKMLKHKYSQRYRKIRQDFSSVLVRELGPDELNQYAAQMEALYKQVTEKQLVRMGTINRNFFSGMHEALGEQYKVCGFFLEGELIAFSSALLHEASYDMNYIGMDYRYNTTHHLYFNLLYHCLEQAIRYQKPCLILGRTALEAKAILGCVPDYRWSYYQIRHPLLRGIFHQVSRLFRHNQGEGWKSRHPFKSAYYKVGSDSGNSV